MNNKISVITVVFNDVSHIESTMKSFFSQTWKEKEYIVIDGGSTDGTKDLIAKYAENIAYWCSESDKGLYDAMNKGIKKATGDWIIFLNSGDKFSSETSLQDSIQDIDYNKTDIIYGNSIAIYKEHEQPIIASEDISLLDLYPIYRHGSSLIKASLQKNELFDLSQSDSYGYALDWLLIHKLYKKGCRFHKSNCFIESFLIEGTSNNPCRNLWYNYRITTEGKFSLKKTNFLIKEITKNIIKRTCFFSLLRAFIIEYLPNDCLPHIPFWNIRKFTLSLIGLKIGKGSFIMKKNYFINPNLLSIGRYSHINRDCIIDARGGIMIGDNVSISHRVNIITGSHNINSKDFMGQFRPIVIDNYAWLGIGCTILQGIHIGKGAVVAAGAVVTSDVEPYTVVAGIPAKKISERPHELSYHCKWNMPLT